MDASFLRQNSSHIGMMRGFANKIRDKLKIEIKTTTASTNGQTKKYLALSGIRKVKFYSVLCCILFFFSSFIFERNAVQKYGTELNRF